MCIYMTSCGYGAAPTTVILAFVGIHRWHGDTERECITSMNEQMAKETVPGIPLCLTTHNTFAYSAAARQQQRRVCCA